MATLQIDLFDVVHNRRLWVSLRDNLPVSDLIQKLVSDLELSQGEYQLIDSDSKKQLRLDTTLKEQNVQDEQKLRIQKKKKGPAVIPVPIVPPSEVAADSRDISADTEIPDSADADINKEGKKQPDAEMGRTSTPPPPPPPHQTRAKMPDNFLHRPFRQPRFLHWIPASLWFYMRPIIIITILLVMLLCYFLGLCVCRRQGNNTAMVSGPIISNPSTTLIPTNTPQPIPPTATPDLEQLVSALPTTEPPYHGTCYVIFNTEKEPFDNVNIRRAFSQAVDRDYLTENAVCNCGFTERQTSTSLHPRRLYSQMSGSEDDSEWFDSEFIKKAGPDFYDQWVSSIIENGYQPEEMKVELATSAGYDPIIETIGKEWAANLGVEVETNIYEFDELMDIVDSEDAPQAYLTCGYTNIPSPFDTLYAFIMDYYGHFILWDPPTSYLQILLRAYENDDMSLYMEAERMLIEEYVVVMPIYHYVQAY